MMAFIKENNKKKMEGESPSLNCLATLGVTSTFRFW